MVQQIDSTKPKPLKSVLWKNNSYSNDIRESGIAMPILLLQNDIGAQNI